MQISDQGSCALDGTSFKISDSQGATLSACRNYNNKAVAFWTTAGSTNVQYVGVVENGPGAGATASVKTDSATMSTIVGMQVVTATATTTNTVCGQHADVCAGGTGNVADGTSDVIAPG
jgi:hypothetical protein